MISFILISLVIPLSLSQPTDFAARPLRIRLVNYDRRHQLRHAPTPAEQAERAAAAGVVTNRGGPSIDFTKDQETVVVSSGPSYLHQVRKRMRGSELL